MYFQEFDCLAAYQLVLFAVGICIMFAGLYVLSVESAKVAKTGRGTLSSRDLTSGARHGAVSASSNGASNGVSGLHNGPCKVSPTHRAPDAAPRRVTAKAVKPKALGVGAGVGVGVAAGVGVETPTPTPTLNPNP